MKMIKIAVCDDEPYIRSYLAALIRRQGTETEITEYASPDALLRHGTEYDLLFLDIEWKYTDTPIPPSGISGMDLARQIRASEGPQPLIVFVTGYESYIYDAFDVDAFQYLLKPIDEARFTEIFRRAADRITEKGTHPLKKLVIQYAGTSKILPTDEISYIESQGHKVILHLKDTTLEYYAKLGDLEQELQGQFCRIHKGILVNLNYVEEYSRTTVSLTGGIALNLSKYKYDGFVRAHLQFIRNSP